MAVGDVIVEIGSVPAGGNLDFQPAAGVEVQITGLAPCSGILAPKLYDGVNEVSIGRSGCLGVVVIDTTLLVVYREVFINNGHYLRIYNSGAAAINAAYWGVQTK